MRLGIYYDSYAGTGFRNDGNPLYVFRALKRRQGIGLLEVDHLAPKEDMKLFGTYDANIWVDFGEDGLKGVIPYDLVLPPSPRIYWCSDSHLGYEYRRDMAKKFDYVFVAQKRAMEDFAKEGIQAEWLPHAFEPEAYHDLEFHKPFECLIKKYDVAFVGNVNNEKRIDFLDRMFKEFPNFYFGQARFQEAAKKFSQAKICLNVSHVDDINMRTFEIMGSGNFLLTEWIPTIEELFQDGVHCAMFKTFDEAVDKAKYYLAHDDERERIAKAGYEECMRKHTIDHRVDRILNAIENKLLVKELV
jgi:hypothetical protein